MPGYVDHSQRQQLESENRNEFVSTAKNITTSPKAALDWAPHLPPYPADSATTRGQARKEWDNVSARIAARTAAGRSSKRFSRGESSNRVQKSNGQRKHNPNLSIDTTVSRHIGLPPQQVQSKGPRKRSSGYKKLDGGTQPKGQQQQSTLVQQAQQTLPAFDPRALGITMVSQFSPETPTIVITPALDGPGLRPGKHVASSVYSRATMAPSFTEQGPVPPLPTYRPYFPQAQISQDKDRSRESIGTDFEDDNEDEKKGHERMLSAGTLFEEDQTPLTVPARTEKKSKNLYIDTTIPPTPRRSRGWWNVITTPFENAKSISRYLRSPTDGSRTPDVPPLPNTLFPPSEEKDDTLSPESASWRSLFHSQSQKAKAYKDSDRLRPNTHNSQALRRLEADERVPTEPVPSIPAQHSNEDRKSEYDTFSPNDREVPFVLSFDQPSQNGQSRAAEPGNSRPSQTSPKNDTSPQSGVTEFSPAGQVAGIGTVLSSKAVVNDGEMQTRPGHNLSLSSASRSSLAAEIVKHQSSYIPYRSGDYDSPYYSSQQQRGAPNQPMTFQPPPRMSEFPPARFSEYTVAKEKPKRKAMYFTICVGKKKEKNQDPKTKKSKRRWCCCCLCFLLLLIVGAAIALAVILSNRRKSTTTTGGSGSRTETPWIEPQPSQFLTVSNFPPVPTGALTIARPNLRTSVSGCVNPKAMWSCAVPKEQQASIKPNDPDQPNFVVTINYDNSTDTSSSKLRARDAASGSLVARSWVRRAALKVRELGQSSLYIPSPAPPTLEEQAFLGNTTDGNSAPFEGEVTPFFISFKPPVLPSQSKVKRQSSTKSSDSSSTSSPIDIPNIATAIPIPNVNPDGTAQPANLLPYPVYQPLRLYNRGKSDEHYGFYTYFERNIFLKSIRIQNTTQQLMGDIASDANGGSAFLGATARCSWRDTRFKVQIWTNKNDTAKLLPTSSGGSAANPSSAAQDFSRPGTFPYPVTISLDRHGGGLTTKMLFCYGLDERGHIDINSRKFQPENRDFAGDLVNPALGPFTSVNVTLAQGGPGGVDGGSGGCECEWANWLSE